MKRKPSRTFIYLAVVMIVLMVMGLVVIGLLISNQSGRFAGDMGGTRDDMDNTNPTVAYHAIQTATFMALQTQQASQETATP